MTPEEKDEALLTAFITWLPRALPAGNVMVLMAQYRDQLPPGADAEQVMATIIGGMRTRKELWPLLFDKIYESDAPGFRTAPTALLEAATAGRAPGKALDVCMGEGRNAVYLARQGWTVTGFDVSAKGLARARERAARTGIKLTTVLQSSETFDYGASRWDLIALFYAPVPVIEPSYAARLERALKPGGLIVLESFASDRDAPLRRPVDLNPEDLRRAFAGLELSHFEDVYELSDWEPQPTRLVRMVAQKPRMA